MIFELLTRNTAQTSSTRMSNYFAHEIYYPWMNFGLRTSNVPTVTQFCGTLLKAITENAE